MTIFKVVVKCVGSVRQQGFNTAEFRFDEVVYYVNADTKGQAISFAEKKFMETEIIPHITSKITSVCDSIGIWNVCEEVEDPALKDALTVIAKERARIAQDKIVSLVDNQSEKDV